jgi:UDP-N-acetylglucosamine 2-epimerase (non-hydrolysing)
MLAALDGVLNEHDSDWVPVYGNTNSTVAGALSAVKVHIAHLKSALHPSIGLCLKSTTVSSSTTQQDLCLAPTRTAMRYLASEDPGARSVMVGDVMTHGCLVRG